MPKRYHFVTGCDSGFGNNLVRKLAQGGEYVFAGVYEEKSKGAFNDFPTITPVQVDVTDDASVTQAVEFMAARLAQEEAVLWSVVNNAGLMLDIGPMEWMPMGHLRKMLAVNVEGPARVTKACLPLLRVSRGRLVNVASILGRLGCPLQGFYSTSKFATRGFTDAIRPELAPFGISVHLIEPGVFPHTGLYKTYYDGFERMWAQTPQAIKDAYSEEWREQQKQEILDTPKQLGNTNVDEVPNAVLHAMLSEKALHRYRCGVDAKIAVPMLEHLPDVVVDLAFNKPMAKDGGPRAQYNSKMKYFMIAAGAAAALAKL